jgi:hypothetical protein
MASIVTQTPRSDTRSCQRRGVVGDRDIEFAVAVKIADRDSPGSGSSCHSWLVDFGARGNLFKIHLAHSLRPVEEMSHQSIWIFGVN